MQSYIEAYNIPAEKYNSAGACAKRLLKDVRILTYINKIMSETGFSEVYADKQLSFLMTQNAELPVKLGAVKHYNELKQRINRKLEIAVDKDTATLLGLIDGSTKGKLPSSTESEEAGE